jgi:membrane fusion protein, heavy metal efflux system
VTASGQRPNCRYDATRAAILTIGRGIGINRYVGSPANSSQILGCSRMTKFGIPDDQQGATLGRRRTRSRIALVLILVVVALLGVAYRFGAKWWDPPARAQVSDTRETSPTFVKEGSRITVPQGSPIRSKLVIQAIGEKESQRSLTLPAVVEADPAHTVKVLPPVAGRVTDLKIRLGERVTQGQELVVIDSGDLAQAYADDEKARASVKLTKQALDRLLNLEKYSAISVKDREQAQNDYAQAEAEQQRAQRRLRAIGVSGEPKEGSRLLSVKAPVSGSIIDLQIAAGAVVNDPTAAIMTIANLDTIWVTANVPEKDTALVAKGQSANVVFTAYPGEVFKGEVLFVSDVLDPDTRRTKVRIAFRNPDMRLKPNMFANAVFLSPKQMMAVVPTTALVLRDEKDQIFVEVAPWVFEARPVDIAFQQGDQVMVQSGVKTGERVVVKGGVLLDD